MKKLTAQLPETIPLASDADDIVRVITTIRGIDNSVCGTFNRRFDIIFAEDCRDANGRLKNIRRGDAGMPCVIEASSALAFRRALETPRSIGGNTQITLQMSKSNTPTLPWVLPISFNHVAASAGLEKLETYYAKACACHFNIIATVLHPSLGLSWFRKLDQGEERPEYARILFTHAFQAYKKPYDDEKAASRAQKGNSDAQARPEASASFLDDICMFDVDDDDETPPTCAISELDQFFSAFQTYGRGDHDGPLLWWKEFAHHFPVVARMARDFLAIPGTSVSVERLFSKSLHLCHEARGSTKAETIMKAMLTKMWIKTRYLDYWLFPCCDKIEV
ncbi:HATC-domain-containing protein [Mycena venus]|uniref:HATC-domain-containing protein n=1 Tax=Mycena venus TaxID=2733690 RepID=A0A8H6Z5Y6_9AGAR|nr:HATC-domain-containing protein [Mycena venus]